MGVKLQSALGGSVELNAPSTASNFTMTVPAGNGTVATTDQLISFRNRIINGAMMIDQRNAGASVTPTDGQYTLDRWKTFASQTGKMSIQQNAGSVTPPIGYSKYLGVTSLSAYSVTSTDYFAVVHPIEGQNVADMAWGTASAATVTLSFWVRSSLAGTFGGAFRNGAGNRSYPFTYTISSANTWEQKTITIAGDTSGTWVTTNAAGAIVEFGLGVGSTYSGAAGAWAGASYESATGATSVVGTNGATFYITGVQLEKGSTATPFEYRDYGRELQMCQRYYELIYADGQGVMPLSYAYNAYNNFSWYQFNQEKRATPTVNKLAGTWSGGSAVPYPSLSSMTFFATSPFYLASQGNVNTKTFEIVSEL